VSDCLCCSSIQRAVSLKRTKCLILRGILWTLNYLQVDPKYLLFRELKILKQIFSKHLYFFTQSFRWKLKSDSSSLVVPKSVLYSPSYKFWNLLLFSTIIMFNYLKIQSACLLSPVNITFLNFFQRFKLYFYTCRKISSLHNVYLEIL